MDRNGIYMVLEKTSDIMIIKGLEVFATRLINVNLLWYLGVWKPHQCFALNFIGVIIM